MRVEPIKVIDWALYICDHPYFTGCLVDQYGDVAWYKNGRWHREDGPSIEYTDGSKWWHWNGEGLTEQEHRMIIRRKKIKLLLETADG